MWVRGQLWRGDYHWNLCRISFDGGEYIEGKREKIDIDSGIVSVVTSKCVVEYECRRVEMRNMEERMLGVGSCYVSRAASVEKGGKENGKKRRLGVATFRTW